MRARKCIICGEEGAIRHRLPHGSVWVCNYRCIDILISRLQGGYTIASVSLEDLLEREMVSCDVELSDVSERDMAHNIRDSFWSDDIATESYKNNLEAGARYIEELRVRTSPKEQLPELIGDLKYEESIRLLEARLKRGE